jgi:ATP-dependent DNA ligase
LVVRAEVGRVLAFTGSAGVMLQSRQLRDLTRAFPDVAAAVAQLGDVVVDGEVVIWRAARPDFGALQDRLRSGPARVRGLVAATPASYVVFDLLARNGKTLLDRPYWKRRRKLEKLALPPGLVVTPASTDLAVAASWMDLARDGAGGLEGVVAKNLDQPYRPGQRGWQKLRARVTAEAVVGGVTGALHAPHELILGRFDGRGRLRIAGRTTAMRAPAAMQLGALLEEHPHSWPERLPAHSWGAPRTAYTRVRPELVVEVSADLAVDGVRWRHPLRYIRYRAELRPSDLLSQSSGADVKRPGQ